MTPEHFAALKADFMQALGAKGTLYVADLFGGSQPWKFLMCWPSNAARLRLQHCVGPGCAYCMCPSLV